MGSKMGPIIRQIREAVTDAARYAGDGLPNLPRLHKAQISNMLSRVRRTDYFDGSPPSTGSSRPPGWRVRGSRPSEILDMPHGSRPDPSSYLSNGYVRQHRRQFEGGASRFQGLEGYEGHGPYRTDKDGSGFVLPSSEVDRILARANGDPRVIERELGLPDGQFGDGPIAVVDFPDATPRDIELPWGNEGGANDQWVPGGMTAGGVPEGVLYVDGPGGGHHEARQNPDGTPFVVGGS